MLLRNARVFTDGHFAEGTDILVSDGRIAAIGRGLKPDGGDVLDLNGDMLLPGFVDVHIHAFMGMDTMNGEAAVRHMSRELRKLGVAAFLPTTMSAAAEDTVRALRGIKAVMASPEPGGAAVLGAHMEAPFLSEKKAGAQLTQFFAKPCEENWRAYTGDCAGIVRLITLAPELDGALELTEYLSKRGITVSLGHTAATAEQTHEAAARGATHVTHTFNAQTPLNHREPGVPGAALTDARLYCEVIADGIHLHPDVIRLIVNAKGASRTTAITDAMEAAGMPEGRYSLGGQDVYVKDGAARLENGVLAGSTLTMARAFKNLVRFGASPEQAALMTTAAPADSIGCKEYGRIAVGAAAAFARMTADCELVSAL